jgi:hypothetical protein
MRVLNRAAVVALALTALAVPAAGQAAPRHKHHCKRACAYRRWARRVTAAAEHNPMVLCIEWRESTSTPTDLHSPDTNPGQTGLAQWDQNAWMEDDVFHYASTPMGASGLEQEAVLVWAINHGRSGQWTPFDGCSGVEINQKEKQQ